MKLTMNLSNENDNEVQSYRKMSELCHHFNTLNYFRNIKHKKEMIKITMKNIMKT